MDSTNISRVVYELVRQHEDRIRMEHEDERGHALVEIRRLRNKNVKLKSTAEVLLTKYRDLHSRISSKKTSIAENIDVVKSDCQGQEGAATNQTRSTTLPQNIGRKRKVESEKAHIESVISSKSTGVGETMPVAAREGLVPDDAIVMKENYFPPPNGISNNESTDEISQLDSIARKVAADHSYHNMKPLNMSTNTDTKTSTTKATKTNSNAIKVTNSMATVDSEMESYTKWASSRLHSGHAPITSFFTKVQVQVDGNTRATAKDDEQSIFSPPSQFHKKKTAPVTGKSTPFESDNQGEMRPPTSNSLFHGRVQNRNDENSINYQQQQHQSTDYKQRKKNEEAAVRVPTIKTTSSYTMAGTLSRRATVTGGTGTMINSNQNQNKRQRQSNEEDDTGDAKNAAAAVSRRNKRESEDTDCVPTVDNAAATRIGSGAGTGSGNKERTLSRRSSMSGSGNKERTLSRRSSMSGGTSTDTVSGSISSSTRIGTATGTGTGTGSYSRSNETSATLNNDGSSSSSGSRLIKRSATTTSATTLPTTSSTSSKQQQQAAAPRPPVARQKCVEVVRKRSEREALPGHTCTECAPYYRALLEQGVITEDRMLEVLQNCSRHKSRWTPPSTPEGFWDLTMRTPEDWKKQDGEREREDHR